MTDPATTGELASLDKLSRSPIMTKRGLYVDGGISEYSLAVVKPVRDFFASQKKDERPSDFLARKYKENPVEVTNVIYANLREKGAKKVKPAKKTGGHFLKDLRK